MQSFPDVKTLKAAANSGMRCLVTEFEVLGNSADKTAKHQVLIFNVSTIISLPLCFQGIIKSREYRRTEVV